MTETRYPSTGYYSLRAPVAMRGSLMLEVAAELARVASWPHKQPLIQMRAQGADEWAVTLFGSDSPDAVHLVARKEVTFAIVNPGAILALALRGLGPFPEPVPVRTIAVMPQFDQLGFAVTADTGLTTLTQLRDQQYPLKVTLRGQRNHSQHVVIREVLAAIGMKVEDIEAWGGELIYEPGTPDARLATVRSGRANALWDEAMPMYAADAIAMGMRFLTLEPDHLQKLREMGLRAIPLSAAYPQVKEEIWTIDFSGWPIYTHADTPDDIVEAFCRALDTRKDRIPHRQTDQSQPLGDLPLDEMCG